MSSSTHLGPWTPLEVAEVVSMFGSAPFRWWMAGGHALEMHLGRSWRDHDDTDIGIARIDAPLLHDFLPDWDIHLASDGVLASWDGRPMDGPLTGVVNLWCRPTPDSPWAIDVLVGEGDQNEWVYKHDTSLRRAWNDAVLRTTAGMPYLAPEIQLLFKSRKARPKDETDAAAVIPSLAPERRSWLAERLPTGHPWLSLVEAANPENTASTNGADSDSLA